MSRLMQRPVLTLLKSCFVRGVVCNSRFSNKVNVRRNECNTDILGFQQQIREFRSGKAGAGDANQLANPKRMTSEVEALDTMSVWPEVLHGITHSEEFADVPKVRDWLIKSLQYNVPGGKQLRSFMLTYAYKSLVPPEQLTEENIRLAKILGCSMEIAIAGVMVLDDIIDKSTIRRDKPCWHVYSNLGMRAISDTLLLERCVYQVVRMFFKDKDCYFRLVETFDKLAIRCLIGEQLDEPMPATGPRCGLTFFDMGHYECLTKYKAGDTFAAPVMLAMHFAGIKDVNTLKEAEDILIRIGQFYQVQDDYLDIYGTDGAADELIDIQEGKLSWIAIVAFQRATAEQKKILEECYGRKEQDKVQRVKQLYDELDLRSIYFEYEEQMYDSLKIDIENMSGGLPNEIFFKLLNLIYQRDL